MLKPFPPCSMALPPTCGRSTSPDVCQVSATGFPTSPPWLLVHQKSKTLTTCFLCWKIAHALNICTCTRTWPPYHHTERIRQIDNLKTLSLWRFTAEEIIALLHSVTPPQHGLAMRFVDIRSEDPTFARIYPLDLPPHLTVFAATRLEIQVTHLVCTFHAIWSHSAIAIQWDSKARYLSTSAVMRHVAQGPFNLVRELWMPVHVGGINIPLEFPALELLVLGRDRSLALGFSGMLAPRGGGSAVCSHQDD